MASRLIQLLCCIGRRTKDPTALDERSRLIPASIEDETITTHEVGSPGQTVLDHDLLKERLGFIVRSKEGRMVNVCSPLPFNIRNKPQALIDIMSQGDYISSSSRSASESTIHESQSPQRHVVSRPPQPLRIGSGLRITSLRSEPPSLSRSHSRSSLSSTTSYSDSCNEAEGGGLKKSKRHRVFGMRLVYRESTRDHLGQRGRRKVDSDTQLGFSENEAAGTASTPISTESNTAAEVNDLVHATILPPSVATNGTLPETPYGPKLLHSPMPISPALDNLKSRLHEIGALSASWGD